MIIVIVIVILNIIITCAEFSGVLKYARQALFSKGIRDANHPMLVHLGDIVNGIEEEGESEPKQFIYNTFADAMSVYILVKGLTEAKYNHLLTICFWNAKMGEIGGEVLAAKLHLLPKVTKLELLDCALGPKTCKALAKAFRKQPLYGTPNIIILRLSHNPIGSSGLAYLAGGLQYNTKITTLGLDYCNIDFHGGHVMSELLQTASLNLTDLNLEGNPLLSAGVVDLAKGIKKNRKLQALNLSITKCGGDLDAVDALARAFRKNTTLCDINLDGNLFGNDGVQFFLEFLTGCRHIENFEVSPLIKSVYFNAIQDWLKSNVEFNKQQAQLEKKRKKVPSSGSSSQGDSNTADGEESDHKDGGGSEGGGGHGHEESNRKSKSGEKRR